MIGLRAHLQIDSILHHDRSAMWRTLAAICVAGALGAAIMVAALAVAPFVY